MKKLFAYSYIYDQVPLYEDHAVIDATASAIREYWHKRNTKVHGGFSDFRIHISYDEEYDVEEYIYEESDIEPALDALNNL